MKIKLNKIKEYVLSKTFIYRYDLLAISIMALGILYYASVLLQPGHVVFSDIDFPFYSKNYMDEIVGLWNTRWNTVSLLNIPRLFFILPLYILSGIFDWNGHLFLKGFILEILFLSAFSMYLMSKRIVSVYLGSKFNLWKITALIFGGLFYALNPWVVFRIQHIYLLTGYSLFPLVILYFFKIFDHKFQKQMIQGYNMYSSKIYSKNILDILILAYLITMSSAAIHYFFYSILLLGLLYLLLNIKYLIYYSRRGKQILKSIFKAILKKTLILVALISGLSLYWLSIYVGGILFDVGASQHNINVIDTYTMFSRHASLDQVLLMLGYWWPMIDLSELPMTFYIGGGILISIMLLGIFKYSLKNHIVLFFALLGSILIIIALGVYYPSISKGFLTLANLPFFGNIFRDPHKVIGLLAIVYSLLLVFGIEAVYLFTEKYKYHTTLKVLFSLVLLTAGIMYLSPIRSMYFERFFQPIEEPVAYTELRNYYLETSGSKSSVSKEEPYALYLPVAEQMLRPITHIATPKWNTPEGYTDTKATGDIHIYNSPINTLFHHEGNDPTIKYYFDLMQLLLDQGRTTHINELAKVFGINQLIYHKEYLDQEARQSFNEAILDVQSGSVLAYRNSIFSVFDIAQNRKENNFSHRRIFTPYGLSKMNSYMSFTDFDPLETPVIFMNKEEAFDLNSIGKNDIVEYRKLNDLIMSSVDSKHRVYPFNFVDEVNPYSKWSKTYTTFADWAWFQKKLDVIHPSFDFDNDHGMVLTFASQAFDVEPHMKKTIEGEMVYDFDSLLRADNFFMPDNSDLFEVVSNPFNIEKNVGVLHGTVFKGDPSFIWQVAKSPVLSAEEKMPYQFRVLVSGRGANKLHMKARFYDKNRNEIGIQYIVGPSEETNFDTVDFTGEVVSPKDTAFFRLDLLTYQRPDSKIYWWIHDVEIKKFPKYTSPNAINMNTALELDRFSSSKYRVFMKYFKSEQGGLMDLEANEVLWTVNSKSNQLSGFEWIDLGLLDVSGENIEINLTNISGFNAVQSIVVIPVESYDDLKEKWLEVLKSRESLLVLETEMNFERDGNIQSRRLYPAYSYGTGTALSGGEVTSEFEVVAPGDYDMEAKILYSSEKNGYAKVSIVNALGEVVVEKLIKSRRPVAYENDLTVEYNPLGQIYPYSVLDYEKPWKYENVEIFDQIPLQAGKYSINMEIVSGNSNYAPLSSFHTFDPSSIITESVLRDQAIIDCSTCERITPEMMRHIYKSDKDMMIEFDPTCSCDWYISSSDPIQVDAHEELLISFEARSEAIDKRHSKMIFLDAYNQVVSTAFIFEVEEQEKIKWNRYEQIVKVPVGAEKVLYQFWSRANKTRMGTLEVKNFKLEKYSEFVMADYVTLKSSTLDLSENDIDPVLVYQQDSEMKFSHYVEENYNDNTIWNSFLSPHKIWRVNNNPSKYKLNGVTMGFAQEGGDLHGKMKLSFVYHIGLGLHFVTILVVLLILWHIERRTINGEKSTGGRR